MKNLTILAATAALALTSLDAEAGDNLSFQADSVTGIGVDVWGDRSRTGLTGDLAFRGELVMDQLGALDDTGLRADVMIDGNLEHVEASDNKLDARLGAAATAGLTTDIGNMNLGAGYVVGLDVLSTTGQTGFSNTRQGVYGEVGYRSTAVRLQRLNGFRGQTGYLATINFAVPL